MPKITLRLTEDAAAGWNRVTESNGITMTAYAEAIGLSMYEHGIHTEAGRLIIERARQIDAERRSRR